MLSNEEFEEKMRKRRMTIDGAEIPDSKPMQPTVSMDRQPSMFDHMRQMMARELALRARTEAMETVDDSLDMGDDEEELIEALSVYERADLEAEIVRRTLAESRSAAPAASPGAPAPNPPSDGPGLSPAPGQPPKAADGGSGGNPT